MPHDILASSRRKKRKKSILKIGLFAAGIFVLIAGLISFFYIPKFRINEIAVLGAKASDENEIKGEIENFLKGKIFKILPCNNIFLMPKARIAASLLQDFPILKNAAIDRNFFQKISVLVEERKPAAILCVDETKCVFMDGNGFIFQEAPSFSGGIFTKFIDARTASSSRENSAIGQETISQAELQKLLSFEKLLYGKNMIVSKILLKDGGEYEIHLKEAWRILINSKNDSVQSFNNLMLVLDSNIKEKRPQLDYVDLRLGNKVYFKYNL